MSSLTLPIPKHCMRKPLPEEYLRLEGLNLSFRDPFDWVFPNGGSGTGSGPCESILVYGQCNLGGNADGHWPVLQNDGVTYCSGSPLLYIDFSHCENYGVPDPPVGDPPGGDDGSGGDQLIGGGGSGGGSSGGDGDTTLTAPVELADPRCPEGSGKVMIDGVCVCPTGYTEDDNGKCILDDCDTSKEDLKKIFPNASDSNLATLAAVINEKGKDFGINTKEKLQHFLAQVGHETGGLNTLNVTESTYWTTASSLTSTYTKFTMDSAQASTNAKLYYAPDYLRNSSGVANIAMCCRMGNGNVASGDGYKYRGRGMLQLTGEKNYTAFKTWYNNKYDPDKDFVTNPNLVSSNDTIAILSAFWYYKRYVLNGDTFDNPTVTKITRIINGRALKGLKARFQKAKDSINCIN